VSCLRQCSDYCIARESWQSEASFLEVWEPYGGETFSQISLSLTAIDGETDGIPQIIFSYSSHIGKQAPQATASAMIVGFFVEEAMMKVTLRVVWIVR
jgi:hypothetical protein